MKDGERPEKRRDWKVVILSLLGLVCMILTFTVNWMFIALAAIFSGWGWKILMKKDKVNKKNLSQKV